MATRRQGDLRLLKDGVLFGPTDRHGLEKLLAAGRVTADDRVSVCNADWVRIADYLSATAMPPPKAPPTASRAAQPRKQKGNLRLLTGGRIIASLHRDDVERLRSAARVGDDDLVCALNGPWMRVGDFFALAVMEATSPVVIPDVERQSPPVSPAAPGPIPIAVPALMPIPVPAPAPPSSGASCVVPPWPLSVQPATSSAPPHHPAEGPHQTALSSAAGYFVAAIPPPAAHMSDEWFVRVRGIHSAPLKKHHIEALFQACEITLDSVARHPTWAENDWRPVRSVPELADIARP